MVETGNKLDVGHLGRVAPGAPQDRVKAEKSALDENIAKLDTFVSGNELQKLSANAQTLLVRQLAIMRKYSQVLGERLALFDQPTK